ncbi:hypothetical protein OAA09_00970 [bacterium]|nr:hypothetical protein [bacterium]
MKGTITIICVAILILIASTGVVASDVPGLERDAKALELYLQDKKDYEDHCSHIPWAQPKLSVYKEKLKSQLPDGCIK